MQHASRTAVAVEVTELVNEGPAAFHRGLDSRMAMGPGGPRNTTGAAGRTGNPVPSRQHAR